MKPYNLSKIMKRAHNLFKTGKYTWSEALKKSWKMAKFNVWMKEQQTVLAEERAEQAKADELKRIEDERLAEERKRSRAPETRSAYDFVDYSPYSDSSKGYLGSHYCGD